MDPISVSSLIAVGWIRERIVVEGDAPVQCKVVKRNLIYDIGMDVNRIIKVR